MSTEHKKDEAQVPTGSTAAPPPTANAPTAANPPAATTDGKLAELMAAGNKQRPAPDLDRQALAAAEAALAEGERALAAARAQLQPPPAPKRSRGRELALRTLLLVNVVAMVTVMLLPPGDQAGRQPKPTTPTPTTAVPPPVAEPEPAPVVRGPDLYLQALEQADRGNYQKAIELGERYLEASPRLPPARRFNVYQALSHYAAQIGDDTRAADYDRKAASVLQTHRLPDDLVALAQEAKARGDGEALRRYWARFLLQERQIPSSLYKHVAEAYLELGDSFRMTAQQAQDEADKKALEELRSRLRQEAGAKPSGGGH